MGCQGAQYTEPLKKLHNLGCLRAFLQTLQRSLTAIHPVGLLNWNYMWFDVFVIFVALSSTFPTHFKPTILSQHTPSWSPWSQIISARSRSFNASMAFLGHCTGECLFMARRSHLGCLKSKLRSNWNYLKIKTTWKWKYDLKKNNKSSIYLRPVSAMTMVNGSSWPVSAQ